MKSLITTRVSLADKRGAVAPEARTKASDIDHVAAEDVEVDLIPELRGEALEG